MADELRKGDHGGVGAVAHGVEKTADAISEATKGENRERVKAAVDDLAKKVRTPSKRARPWAVS
jgi:hypothetical protein